MVKISSATAVMEAYYKLTQSPSQMEEELKNELKNPTGDTSSLDDLTELVGAIKDEVQFLNKAKDTFNEIYKVLEEAHTYLSNLNPDEITGQAQVSLKFYFDEMNNYIGRINAAVSNVDQNNFSNRLVDYIKKLTAVDLGNIHATLSDHEVQTKSRLLGGIDSSISTTEILDAKSITVAGHLGKLNLSQFTGESAKTLASEISHHEPKTGVVVDARNTLSISDFSANGTFTFKITNSKTGNSGHTISGINITDNADLTPLFEAINNAHGKTNIRAELRSDKAMVSMIDDSGDNINLTAINEASGAKTFNVFSEYRKSSRDADLNDVTMNFGSDVERAGGYIEFYGHDKLRAEDISIDKSGAAIPTLGVISIVGDQISIGTGTDTSPIGYIHSTIDGEDGARLRVKFYETIFPNGDFEAGNIGDTSLNGWTIANQQFVLGSGQIGGLNTPTDDNYPLNNNGQLDVGNLTSGTFSSSLVASTQGAEHGKALEMKSDTLWTSDRSVARGGQGNAIARGPYIVSDNPLYLRSGEEVSFDWRAVGGGDAYDVYGYLVNSDTNEFITILNQTGGDNGGGISYPNPTNWANSKTDITKSGNYKFVFLAGTYDETGGGLMGANLYVDNIAITPGPSLAINNDVLTKIANKITLKDVNMDLADQDLNPRIEAAIAPIGASVTTKAVGDSRTTSLSSSAGGLSGTHTISVAGIYDTVGESIDTRTVTIAANASAKLISEQLNAQIAHTNVGFTAKTGLVISAADGDDTVLFKLSNNNGGTANISANITASNLNNLKTQINNATGTTGVVAANGVVATNDAGDALWTLGDESLLLTHSSGEDIAIAELAGIGLNIQPANYSATTYEDDTTPVTLQAARKLIVDPITSDQRVKITTAANSIQATYRITGTNLSGGAQTQDVTVAHNTTGHTSGSFATVTQVQLMNGTSGSTKVGIGSDDDAIASSSPVNQSNLAVSGALASGGTAYLEQGEIVQIQTGSGTDAQNLTISGKNSQGNADSETITTNPGNWIYTSKKFTIVDQIRVNADIDGYIKAGTSSDVNGIARNQRLTSSNSYPFNLNLNGDLVSSGEADLRGDGEVVTLATPADGVVGAYTITGTDTDGNVHTENLTGTIGGTVSTTQEFATVTNVSVNSLSPGNIKIGTDRDDDGISTNSAYTGNGTATINGSYRSGGQAVLNTSDYDLAVVGTDREGNAISETINVSNSADAESSNYYGTITSIAVSGSGTNTGRVRVYSKTAGDDIASSQIPNSGGNLTLTGTSYQNDSGVVVGALQATSNQRFAITSNSNYYSLQSTSDELDPIVYTTPVPRDTSPGLKVSTNSNHEVFSTGELFLNSNKAFTVTQQDASEELMKITITADSSTPSRNFTISGTDQFGTAVSETITSTTNDTVTGDTPFAVVTGVTVNADTVGVVQVGTSLDPDLISQSQRSSATGSLAINGARTNAGTAGVITFSMANSFTDDQTASFTLEGSTLTYTADGSETAAEARNRLLTNPGANEFQGSDNETITTSSAGVLQVTDKNGANLFTIQSDGSAAGLRLTESNPDGHFSITKTSGNVPPNEVTTVTSSTARRATIIDDGSTFFSNEQNKSEVLLPNFSLRHEFADQEFIIRYAHAMTDVKGAISTIDTTLFLETDIDEIGNDLSIDQGKYSYTREQFLEMGLTTADRLKNLTSKTLLIKNIYSQRANLNMLMSGQMYGFALMNFKGHFDLKK